MSNAFTNPTRPRGHDSTPWPCHKQRDADERLMAVTFRSQATACPDVPDDDWLVALDGSEHALQALNAAMRLCEESGKRVLDLVNVQPWLSREAAESELPGRGWAAAGEACARLDERALGWRLHVLMGDRSTGIVKQARLLGSRGIVIGAHGLSATASLLLGSVAQQVVHSAGRTVLVVRGDVQIQEKRHAENSCSG